MDEEKLEIEQSPDWKEGLTPEQIAFTELQSEALVKYLEDLGNHPERGPSPEESKTGRVMKRIIEEKDKTN